MIGREILETSWSWTRRVDVEDPRSGCAKDVSDAAIISINCAIILRHGVGSGTFFAFKKVLLHRFMVFALCVCLSQAQQIFPQSVYPIAGKDTKDVSLGVRELGWCITAEACKIIVEKRLDSSK
jgi:hypothetical protein